MSVSARPRPRRLAHRAGLLGVATAASLVLGSGVAWAHVTAQPGTAAQGSEAKIAFRVPNEEDNAMTVKLEVTLPPDHPIAEVLVEPVPGWTAEVHKVPLATPIKTDDGEVTQAASSITWSGGHLGADQFQDFGVSLGPLPADTDRLIFKAVQTYSNGDIVRWIDVPAEGAPEPDHPAPVLKLTPATSDQAATDSAVPTAPAGSASGSGAALPIGIIGVVLGLVGVVLGGLALRRRTT